MIDVKEIERKIDNGGRRFSGDRRQFSYAVYLPERRSGEDRRCGKDRRDAWDLSEANPAERRSAPSSL